MAMTATLTRTRGMRTKSLAGYPDRVPVRRHSRARCFSADSRLRSTGGCGDWDGKDNQFVSILIASSGVRPLDAQWEEGMTEAESGLRAVSDELLSELDRLAEIENEKRALDPGDERVTQLATQARQLAERILSTSRAEEVLVQGSAEAIRKGLPGAPQLPIEQTPRALHLILNDWRDAERQASASVPGSEERAAFRRRADAFRAEYQRAFEEVSPRASGDAS
jgi:hypothetical protein